MRRLTMTITLIITIFLASHSIAAKLTVATLAPIASQYTNTFSMGMGFSTDSYTKTENFNLSLKGSTSVSQSLDISYTFTLDKQQSQNKLQNLRMDSEIELAYTPSLKQYYFGIGFESNHDYFGIDQTSTGIFTGINYKPFTFQIGTYLHTKYLDSFLKRNPVVILKAGIKYPLCSVFLFSLESKLKANTTDTDSNNFTFDFYPQLKVNVNDVFYNGYNYFAGIGIKYNYTHYPLTGPGNRRQWLANVGVEF